MQRVLITRPEPGASQTAARLKALGFHPVVAPVLEVIPIAVTPPRQMAAILFTSQNAVGPCASARLDIPVFAVGGATAARAAAAGFGRVHSAAGDASALADLISTMLSPADGSLFLPTAQGQGADLTHSLRRRGFRVLRRVAYKTSGVSTLPDVAATQLSQGDVAFAMFFSGETSRHFERLIRAAGLADELREVEAMSISDKAAVALRTLPWRRIRVAANPNQDAMLALLK